MLPSHVLHLPSAPTAERTCQAHVQMPGGTKFVPYLTCDRIRRWVSSTPMSVSSFVHSAAGQHMARHSVLEELCCEKF